MSESRRHTTNENTQKNTDSYASLRSRVRKRRVITHWPVFVYKPQRSHIVVRSKHFNAGYLNLNADNICYSLESIRFEFWMEHFFIELFNSDVLMHRVCLR